jgi:hypothetical protein
MNENDMTILAMAICDLMGNPVKAAEVRQAFEKASEQIHLPPHAPRPAKISHAIRRGNQTE